MTFGRACLVLALGLELYGITASLYGARRGRPAWSASGRRAVYVLAGVLTLAFVDLELAFLRPDFSFRVVAEHASTTTPPFYRATAMWSAQEGSLLLWVWLLGIWSSGAVFLMRKRLRDSVPYAVAVLLGFAGFFTVLLLFLASPFDVLRPAPAEGAGLTPLLRHPSMMVHPPMLYSGYTLFTIPFAFAVAALVTRRLDAAWVRATRGFLLVAWLCLGVGILLGARWSYSELGWGGYWGWDPVENASLMPWLTGTACLHSVMVQEKRGMLKAWTVSLVLATGILAILGTFLVRSGILDSIHAFGASTLGVPFLVFILALVLGSLALVVSRARHLRSEPRLESLLSREAMLLLNNLVLVGLCFVILWGTFFPLISEAVTGHKSSVGPPWFNRYSVPLALVLVLLAGIGPVVPWRRASPGALRRHLAMPAAAALAVLAALVASGVAPKPSALVLFSLAGFLLAAVGQEFWRGARALQAVSSHALPVAVRQLVARNRHRYGGYLVHAGIAVLLVGVAASSAFQRAQDVSLTAGQSARVGGYDVRYVRPTASLGQEKLTLGAVLDFSRGGRHVATLKPSRAYYPSADERTLGRIGRFFAGESTSEVGLQAGLRRDLWTAVQPDLTPLKPLIDEANRRFRDAGPRLEGVVVAAIVDRYLKNPPPAQFRVIVSPLVTWIWIGGAIFGVGALIAIWPAAGRARRRVWAARRAPRIGGKLREA